MKKGIVFAGCSFTWGQGLYYYSKMSTVKEPAPEQYEHKLVTDAHKRFMATLRFPRLVANHFNTFESFKISNGGSEDETFDFFHTIFNFKDKLGWEAKTSLSEGLEKAYEWYSENKNEFN